MVSICSVVSINRTIGSLLWFCVIVEVNGTDMTFRINVNAKAYLSCVILLLLLVLDDTTLLLPLSLVVEIPINPSTMIDWTMVATKSFTLSPSGSRGSAALSRR